jgi:hypothetical protein
LVGTLVTKPIDPNEGLTENILGETFIKPRKEYSFTAGQ